MSETAKNERVHEAEPTSLLFEDNNTEPTVVDVDAIDNEQVIGPLYPYCVHMYWPGCPSVDYVDILASFFKDEAQLDEFLAIFTVAAGYEKADKEAWDDSRIEGPVMHAAPQLVVDQDSPMRAKHAELHALALSIFKQIYFRT